jgi:hypothetical protein
LENGEGVAADELVVLSALSCRLRVSHCPGVVEKPDFGDPIVTWRHPLIAAGLVGKQPQILVRPGQLKTT